MTRLITRYDDQNAPKGCCTFDRYGEPDDCNSCDEQCLLSDGDCDNCPIQNCFDKLAEYEEKIEKGLMIELSCKVGDTVYEPTRRGINTYKVTKIHISQNGKTFEWECIDGFYTNVYGFDDYKIGDTVFLIKEEAEAKLKELKENETDL